MGLPPVVVGLLVYLPAGWTLNHLAAPISYDHDAEPFRRLDVVLVNRWTASMGEGIAIGLDGMKRATIVGTRMAGLNGGIFNHELPKTKIGVSYPGERLNQINGTPRENFVPPVLVDFMDRRWRRFNDPILAAGYSTLVRVIRRRQ